jgi:hypothetical protein
MLDSLLSGIRKRPRSESGEGLDKPDRPLIRPAGAKRLRSIACFSLASSATLLFYEDACENLASLWKIDGPTRSAV